MSTRDQDNFWRDFFARTIHEPRRVIPSGTVRGQEPVETSVRTEISTVPKRAPMGEVLSPMGDIPERSARDEWARHLEELNR